MTSTSTGPLAILDGDAAPTRRFRESWRSRTGDRKRSCWRSTRNRNSSQSTWDRRRSNRFTPMARTSAGACTASIWWPRWLRWRSWWFTSRRKTAGLHSGSRSDRPAGEATGCDAPARRGRGACCIVASARRLRKSRPWKNPGRTKRTCRCGPRRHALRAVGALRATKACLKCHHDSKEGDLFGAFSYTLKKANP